MNEEAVARELNGQVLKLLEMYQRKEQLLDTVKKAEKELDELTKAIRNSDGVIQTLQFMVQTKGFINMDEAVQGRQPVELPSHTNLSEVNAALKGKAHEQG